MVGEQRHEQDGAAGADEGADGVERLAQAVGRAAHLVGREVGDQRVARRAADALADAIDETRGDDPGDVGRQREQRFRQRGEAVTDGGQPFALAQPVADDAGEHLGDGRGRFRDALDDADLERGSAEHADEIKRQQRMDHLRGGVHEQRHEAERPDAAGDLAPVQEGGFLGVGQSTNSAHSRVGGNPVLPQASISFHRSRQSGLLFSINSSFQFLFHLFICRSRANAKSGESGARTRRAS